MHDFLNGKCTYCGCPDPQQPELCANCGQPHREHKIISSTCPGGGSRWFPKVLAQSLTGTEVDSRRDVRIDAAEQLRRARIALATIMRLVEDGILVRNTKQDADPVSYMRQSTDLILALQQAQEVLAQ